jgi:hypothetical protein
MRWGFAFGALTLALVGLVAFAAQNRASIVASAPAFDTVAGADDITASIDRSAATHALSLSDEQRGLIFVGVINLPDVPDVELPAPSLVYSIPEAVELQELPAMVTSRIPLVKGTSFVKLDDRILLVRSSDRMVVGEIPRYRVWQ